MQLTIEPHPLLHVAAFTTDLPTPLADMPSPDWLLALLHSKAEAPVQRSEALRGAVRDMLRQGGYKPTGRGKPASEYLVRAAEEGGLRPINFAVDVCNVVSLHSGLPISVIDLDLATMPLRIAVAEPGTSYIFNASGQEIDVKGLVCLHDADGPCANAVKDSHRTKTRGETVRTFSVIWGCKGYEQELEATFRWYAELLKRAGATALRIAC